MSDAILLALVTIIPTIISIVAPAAIQALKLRSGNRHTDAESDKIKTDAAKALVQMALDQAQAANDRVRVVEDQYRDLHQKFMDMQASSISDRRQIAELQTRELALREQVSALTAELNKEKERSRELSRRLSEIDKPKEV